MVILWGWVFLVRAVRLPKTAYLTHLPKTLALGPGPLISQP